MDTLRITQDQIDLLKKIKVLLIRENHIDISLDFVKLNKIFLLFISIQTSPNYLKNITLTV